MGEVFQVRMDDDSRVAAAHNLLNQFPGKDKGDKMENWLTSTAEFLKSQGISCFTSEIMSIETSLANVLNSHKAIISMAHEMLQNKQTENADLLKSKDQTIINLQAEVKSAKAELAKVMKECENYKQEAKNAVDAKNDAIKREADMRAAYQDRNDLIRMLRDKVAEQEQIIAEFRPSKTEDDPSDKGEG